MCVLSFIFVLQKWDCTVFYPAFLTQWKIWHRHLSTISNALLQHHFNDLLWEWLHHGLTELVTDFQIFVGFFYVVIIHIHRSDMSSIVTFFAYVSDFFIYYFFFLKINLFFIEAQLLYRILLFSVKLQHESIIGIHISPPFWSSLPSPSPSHASRLIQSPCLSFLSHTANYRWLSILHMVLGINLHEAELLGQVVYTFVRLSHLTIALIGFPLAVVREICPFSPSPCCYLSGLWIGCQSFNRWQVVSLFCNYSITSGLEYFFLMCFWPLVSRPL